MNENENNPAEPELSAPEPAQEPIDTAVDIETSEESSDGPQEPQEEFEEVEYEGKRYAVPKELKDAVLRQADYTRKTQELAQTRQQAEAEFASNTAQIEAERANIQMYGWLTATEEKLQQYRGVDWDQLEMSNRDLANTEYRKFQQLKDAHKSLTEQIKQHEGQRAMHEHQRLQQADAALSREIKGWSPTYAQELREVAKSLGAKEEQLNGIREPWIVKALHAQKVLAEMTKKAGAAAPAVAAKPVRTISGGNAKATVDPDKMSIEDWMRHEQRRTAAARR